MSFEAILRNQILMHPGMMPQDVVKLCYQAAHGPRHLGDDMKVLKERFTREYASVEAADIPLCETVSDDYARLNFAAWKYRGLPQEWAYRMFLLTIEDDEAKENIEEYLAAAEKLLTLLSFSQKQWSEYIESYRASGMPAVHHSESYREREKPAYLLVGSRCQRLVPILERIAKIASEQLVVAIDGRAGSGKSTMAMQLSRITGAEIIHMDDFFLPIDLRSEERFSQAGGNVHYERFSEEVLPYLKRGERFKYRMFSCTKMAYDGEREIKTNPIRIVEGSYSLHPKFGDYADIKVFSDVDAEEQMRRIILRNGEEKAEMFKSRWIPMEEKYFKTHAVSDKCDIIV